MKIVSCWQLGDVYASITVEAEDETGFVTASVGPGPEGGWCAEWWTTSPSGDDSRPVVRFYQRRDVAARRALFALADEERALFFRTMARRDRARAA